MPARSLIDHCHDIVGAAAAGLRQGLSDTQTPSLAAASSVDTSARAPALAQRLTLDGEDENLT